MKLRKEKEKAKEGKIKKNRKVMLDEMMGDLVREVEEEGWRIGDGEEKGGGSSDSVRESVT